MTVDELRRLYFTSEKLSEANLIKLTDFYGDMQFIFGIHMVIKNQVERNSAPTYMYKFTYDQGYTPFKAAYNNDLPGMIKFQIFLRVP